MIRKSLKAVLAIIIAAVIILGILIMTSSRVITDYMWFQNLDYVYTFLVMFFANFSVRLTLGLIFTIFIFLNLYFTKDIFLEDKKVQMENVEQLFGDNREQVLDWLSKKRLLLIYLAGSVFMGFLFSAVGQGVWKTVLKFFNQTSFDTLDPIFSRDLGFYVFSLPFYNLIREMATLLIVITLIVVAVLYVLGSGVSSLENIKIKFSKKAKAHLTTLIVAFLFLKAWDYRLSMFDLLYSERGAAFGASYTDINANLIGLWILLITAIAVGLLLIYSIVKRKYNLIVWGLGIWIGLSIIFGSVYPGVVQRFRVEPNELERERQYIENNIDMTLAAYGLDEVSRREFDLDNTITAEDLEANIDIIDNIRLWDHRPKLSSYGQLQELRPYYRFQDVDIDRYHINGEYRQVMLSARELDKTRLPSRTWVNEKLIYTHGYGIVMSPVSSVISDGMPEFIIRDIPSRTETDIELDNLALYYGEMTDDYVIANTNAREFHYSSGDQNVYRSYTGTGGVEVGSFLRRILFSLRFGDLQIFLTDAVKSDSRMMFNRNIQERVNRIAPFLMYDSDPYLVIENGNLYWIQDAYTTTDRYPYSTPYDRRNNYIRNSVKVVIDAYQGDVTFYIVDDEDPMVQTYSNIFPDLFTDGDEMSEYLRNHIRYPEDLFNIQTQLYRFYHMQDPDVFYNQEDLWDIPTEKYGQASIQMQPYYIMNRLLGDEDIEFTLMLPFTPSTRNNMISWMAARSDGDNYGELVVSNFPEGELVYGPQQIESRIDQHPEISQQLSLWGQRGSRVIRGNLLVIPIENSILYIEPIYIEAEDTQIPEMRRVIVSHGDRLVMAPSLDQGLIQLFGEFRDETIEEIPDIVDEDIPEISEEMYVSESFRELSREAVAIYEELIEAQRAGEWGSYGDLLQELEDVLYQIRDIEAQDSEEPSDVLDMDNEVLEDSLEPENNNQQEFDDF